MAAGGWRTPLSAPSPTARKEDAMAANKTLACGEETNPTTSGGCEEDWFATPVQVENPFGSF
jgi:hypothetical protein